MFKRTKVCSAVLVAFGGTLALGAAPAFGQQTLERVEITGSSIKRVESEGALPVQVVTKEEIARTGATSTEQLLNSLSAVSSMGSTVNATGAGASTYGRSTISLRGLEETRTLVLVNGRRLAAFAGAAPGGGGVNVNAIPLAAIERVEILRDGASAVYGSDAIAGVVNFILSNTYQGMEFSATTGKPSRSGGGGSNKVSVVGGIGKLESDGYNLTLSAGLEKEKALFGRERDFAKTSTVLPFFSGSATGQGNIQGAWIPGTGSVTNNPPNWVQGSGTLGFAGGGAGSSFGNPNAASNTCGDIRMFLVATPTTKGAPYCQYDSGGDVGLIPDRDLATFSANLTVKLSENAQFFGDVLYSRSKVKQTYQPSPIRNSFLVTDAEFANQGVDPVLLISPGSAAYTTAQNYLNAQGFGAVANSGRPFAVTARVFDFGPRSNTDVSKQLRIVGGVRGSFAEQDYEIAAAHNENKLAGTVGTGYFSQVAYAKIINDPNSGWNPWSLTQSPALTQAIQAAAYTGGTLVAKSTSDSIDGKISGDWIKLPAGTAQYAFGLQSRSEKLRTTPSPALETGDIAGLGGSVPPVDRGRTIESIFSELNIPLVKGLESNLAFRGDHYSDVGGAVTGKAALRYQPTKELLFRGSMGTGFRAPTLVDLWQPQTLGTSEQFNDNGQTDLQVPNLSGGNPLLKPETSLQHSLGIVFSPTSTITASIDFFKIKVKGIISTPSAQEVVSQFRLGNPAYQSLVSVDGSNNVTSVTTVLNNTGTANVQGADIELAYRDTFGFGRLDVNLAGTYMSKFDQSTPGAAVSHKVGTLVDDAGNPVIGAQNGGVVLRWKHVLSGTWSVGSWAATLTQNFYKGYQDSPDLNGDPHFVPSQAIYDANIAFTGVKNLKLAIGVKNLFDKNPPIYIPASNQFQAGYDINQYDPRARFFYGTVSYKFF